MVERSRPTIDDVRWRACVVGYLVWLILVTVTEGAGRQVCRVPTARWIAAAADPRDRTARIWFRDRANECLGYTRWYRYSMAGLVAVAVLMPAGAVWFWRQRLTRLVRARRFSGIEAEAALLSGVLVASLAIAMGTMAGVRWLYDWYA